MVLLTCSVWNQELQPCPWDAQLAGPAPFGLYLHLHPSINWILRPLQAKIII